jgi:pimeloyl-ACP methyl ester carboxylesterase
MIKDIVFTNTKGEKIKGTLKEKNTSGPLLIVSHGLGKSKDHPATNTITDKLYEIGHSTFSFTFSKSAQEFNLKEQVSDINDIIDNFKKYKKIMLLAPSLGAVSAVVTAVQSPKVDGIITINGFFGSWRVGRIIIKTYLLFRLIALFNSPYKKNWKYFKTYYQPGQIRCNTLVIHSKRDEVVFISQSKSFFKKLAGRKELFILENADHELTRNEYRQEVAAIIDSWLKNNK